MSEFKLLGSPDPLITSLGVITQGIGFPLRNVEPTTGGGGTVTVRTTTVFASQSFSNQDPVGLDNPLQITFGAPASTTEFSIDAAGALTCLVADEYTLRLKVAISRDKQGGGESEVYLRALLNGVQVSNSVSTLVDNEKIEIPQIFSGIIYAEVGDVFTFEIVRDSSGTNSGGLRASSPQIAGWNPSPSAFVRVDRTYAIQT